MAITRGRAGAVLPKIAKGAAALSITAGLGLSLNAASCDAPEADTDEEIGSSDAALFGGSDCARAARTARADAMHRGKSFDASHNAYDSALAQCAVASARCTCDLERDCHEVAQRRLAHECETDQRHGDHHGHSHLASSIRQEIEHCHRLCEPTTTINLAACVEQVPVRTDIPEGKAREVAYQEDIGRYCGGGMDACSNHLNAAANVDYTAAALQLAGGTMSAAQYLATSRDRTRKLRATEEAPRRAIQLCHSSDSDGDWIPDSLDRCPNTPDLVATDDHGCPETTLPDAPDTAAVRRVLSQMNVAINPNCKDAVVPDRVPAGGFYWPAYRDRGTYILAGRVTNQPTGCSVWYQFEIEEISGPHVGYRYDVAFMDREATTDLVQLGRPVPPEFVQFNPRPNDVRPDRVRLAQTGFNAGIRYRVRAINATGVRGLWSEWKISDKGSCTALGFECGGP